MLAIVTGGAGFIGSHICDALSARSFEVVALDSLCSGRKGNLAPAIRLSEKDMLSKGLSTDFAGAQAAFHYAADPDVRACTEKPRQCFRTNVEGTLCVLEACRKADVKRVVFASTSTVYGQAAILPTPESHPCRPISNYGASKLAAEAYCFAYAYTYGLKATVLRYANIFGPRSGHGVAHDFFRKLQKDPSRLEILGNGRQKKSYLYITDAIEATMLAFEGQSSQAEVYNVCGSESRTVDELAGAVCSHLNLSPAVSHTGGEQGWKGDVPGMLLDSSKLRSLGWKGKTGFEEGIGLYLDWLKSGKAR